MPMGRIPETLPLPESAAGGTQPLTGDMAALPAPPGRVGRYQLVRQLPGGGMGVVFEAVQDEPRRSVALKFMRAGLGSPAAMQRFHDEAQVLARLHHPAIAQIFDAGTHHAHGLAIPYFVMELVPGALPITDYARLHQLSLAQRVELMTRVCQAVQHGHDNGVIHRDLKPANIVIDTTGNPRVIDFGIAQAAQGNLSAEAPTTSSSQLIGTVPYMSPEQCRPECGAVDGRSDVYSLGVVLYELVCGRLPYEIGTDVTSATRIICQQPPVAPSSLRCELRGDIDAVLLHALAKDRAQRYASAGELADDMARALRHEPVAARGAGLAYRTGARLRRLAVQRTWLLALLCIALGFVVANHLVKPGIYKIAPLSRGVERFIRSAVPVASTPLLQDVRILAMTADTDFDQIARSESLEGINTANNRSLRRVHGRLMQKLATARPRVVVFDIGFPGDSEFDPDFVAGANVLRDAGCDVIIGSHTWQPQAPGPQRMSQAIASATRWGGLSAGVGPDAPWRIDLAIQNPGGEALPSLALMALASWRTPGAVPLIDIDPRWHSLQLRLARIGREGSAGQLSVVSTESRAFTGMERVNGAMVASLVLEVPPDDQLAQVSLDYASVFGMSPEQLRQAVGDRVVLIGDARAIGGDGPFEHPDGRRLPGYVAQAAAIDALVRQRIILHPPPGDLLAVELLAGCAGVGLVLVVGGRRAFWMLLPLAGVVIFVGSVLMYANSRYLFNPIIPIASLVTAGGVMAWGARVRARTARWFIRSNL